MKTRRTFDISQFRYISILLVVLLNGCISAPVPVERVEIPVFTLCIKVLPQRPLYEFDRLKPSAADGEMVLALLRDWPRGRKYEVELEAVLAGCLPPEAKTER